MPIIHHEYQTHSKENNNKNFYIKIGTLLYTIIYDKHMYYPAFTETMSTRPSYKLVFPVTMAILVRRSPGYNNNFLTLPM